MVSGPSCNMNYKRMFLAINYFFLRVLLDSIFSFHLCPILANDEGKGGHTNLVHKEFPKVSPTSPGLDLKK